MAVVFKRKLYTRGSSYETTIPIQMLFALDLQKKHNVIFEFDSHSNRWLITVTPEDDKETKGSKKKQQYK